MHRQMKMFNRISQARDDIGFQKKEQAELKRKQMEYKKEKLKANKIANNIKKEKILKSRKSYSTTQFFQAIAMARAVTQLA